MKHINKIQLWDYSFSHINQVIRLNLHLDSKSGIFLFLFILILHPFLINAQKTNLLFSKNILSKSGKMIVIELSDSSGAINPSSEFFNQAEKIYFAARPQQQQDWVLSRKDAEKKMAEIKLLQSTNIVSTAQPKILYVNEEIKAVVLSFPKSQINLLKEIKFKLEETESDPVYIPENLWPKYKTYTEIIANAYIPSINGDYITAL